MLFLLFPRVSGPLWGMPADHAANSGLSDHMAPGIISELSLSDAVAFRVDFDGPVPPPWQRYWRGPGADGLRRPRMDDAGRSEPRDRSRGRTGRRSFYTVTLEPHWKTGCSRSTCRAACRKRPAAWSGGDAHRHRRGAHARPAAPVAPAGHAAASLPAVLDRCATAIPRGAAPSSSATSGKTSSCPPQAAAPIRRRSRSRASFAARIPTTRAYIDAVLDWFHREPFFYTLAPPLLGANPVDGFLFEIAPRLLRALCQRLRRDAARRGDSGARRDRLSGRHDQSERRLHDRAPVGRACVGRGPGRRTMAPLRPDRRRRAVAHPARASAARCPRASPFRCSRASTTASSRACSCPGMRSITTGAAT